MTFGVLAFECDSSAGDLPFHWQPPGFRSFIDTSLMGEEVLGVGVGKWGEEIMIAPADLLKASKARVVNLSER